MLLLSNLSIHIEWEKFKPDTSFFIPCLDAKTVANYVNQECDRLRFRIVSKQVVEKGRYGLRVWRIG